MSLSLRERIVGKEDSDDVSENSITDSLNVADDLMILFTKTVSSLSVFLIIFMILGRVLNQNGITAFNDIIRVALTVFIVGIVLTLSLLIFVYNIVSLVFSPFTDIPQFELTETTRLLIELAYQYVLTG